jgi:hypothetical protein
MPRQTPANPKVAAWVRAFEQVEQNRQEEANGDSPLDLLGDAYLCLVEAFSAKLCDGQDRHPDDPAIDALYILREVAYKLRARDPIEALLTYPEKSARHWWDDTPEQSARELAKGFEQHPAPKQ